MFATPDGRRIAPSEAGAGRDLLTVAAFRTTAQSDLQRPRPLNAALPPCHPPLLLAFGPSHTETAIRAILTLVLPTGTRRHIRGDRRPATIGQPPGHSRLPPEPAINKPCPIVLEVGDTIGMALGAGRCGVAAEACCISKLHHIGMDNEPRSICFALGVMTRLTVAAGLAAFLGVMA